MPGVQRQKTIAGCLISIIFCLRAPSRQLTDHCDKPQTADLTPYSIAPIVIEVFPMFLGKQGEKLSVAATWRDYFCWSRKSLLTTLSIVTAFLLGLMNSLGRLSCWGTSLLPRAQAISKLLHSGELSRNSLVFRFWSGNSLAFFLRLAPSDPCCSIFLIKAPKTLGLPLVTVVWHGNLSFCLHFNKVWFFFFEFQNVVLSVLCCCPCKNFQTNCRFSFYHVKSFPRPWKVRKYVVKLWYSSKENLSSGTRRPEDVGPRIGIPFTSLA